MTETPIPPRQIVPVYGPIDTRPQVPGSKSLTNRALVAAALAAGTSRLEGVLWADDTEAMVDGLSRLGIAISPRVPPAPGDVTTEPAMTVEGNGGVLADRGRPTELDARLSGTTSRFLLPLAALSPRPVRLDGEPGLRARPMGDGFDALRHLAVDVDDRGQAGHLPVTITGHGAGSAAALPVPPALPAPPVLSVAGAASSQFLSGLLLTAPAWPAGLRLELDGPLVSRPYVDMTVAVMEQFGVTVTEDVAGFTVPAQAYRATTYQVEPDASAASYFFAAAAILGGRVTVEGLGRDSLQGDLQFVHVLEQMGCEVIQDASSTTVTSHGPLVGVDVDMSQISDTAQTMAVVAVFASSPSRVRGIGFIRHKETDRVGNVVAELRRCGIEAVEEPDGFLIRPGTPQPAEVQTYDDHRMAMSFALLGLRAPGIRIADPDCVAKTFPAYWDALATLAPPAR